MILECRHLYKSFSGKTILNDCHFSLQKGEIVGLMGESGSGKSTLAKIILGLEKATQGEVLLEGRPYDIKKSGVRILLIFQDAVHSVNPLFTVKEILTEGVMGTVSLTKICDLLKDVGLDDTYLSRTSKELSGGQLQRVCIARALLLDADILIFDEALSGLDPILQGSMLRLLYALKIKYQKTYLFISHDFQLCYALCHRVLVLSHGHIVEEITDFTLSVEQRHPATQRLLTSSNFSYSDLGQKP